MMFFLQLIMPEKKNLPVFVVIWKAVFTSCVKKECCSPVSYAELPK